MQLCESLHSFRVDCAITGAEGIFFFNFWNFSENLTSFQFHFLPKNLPSFPLNPSLLPPSPPQTKPPTGGPLSIFDRVVCVSCKYGDRDESGQLKCLICPQTKLSKALVWNKKIKMFNFKETKIKTLPFKNKIFFGGGCQMNYSSEKNYPVL